MVSKVGGLFVVADDPRYLEQQVDSRADVLDLAGIDVIDLEAKYREREANYTTAPFDPNGQWLRFFPGGFTVWSGYPGGGKTTLLRQLACHLLAQHLGVFVCSLEEAPFDVLMRHACVALGTAEPSTDGLQWCVDTWSDALKLWQYEARLEDAEYLKILAAIRVLARDYGVRHAIIDSLMCLDVSADDWEGQRLFTRQLANTAMLSGVHIHLVAHPRKPRSEAQLDISDVAGAADLGRKADNVLFVKRANNEQQAVTGDCTPMLVSIRKQRYGTGDVRDIAGWYNRRLKQFKLNQLDTAATRYLPSGAYALELKGESMPPAEGEL